MDIWIHGVTFDQRHVNIGNKQVINKCNYALGENQKIINDH